MEVLKFNGEVLIFGTDIFMPFRSQMMTKHNSNVKLL